MSSFAGKIENVSFDGDRADVVLDRTAFFPEEGGQSPDHGTLAGFPVIDVQIRDGKIHHTLDLSRADASSVQVSLAPDSMVEGSLDWEERYSNMQQHSGEHLFSGIAHRLYGVENVGFHLSSSEVTLDFDRVLTEEQLEKVEAEANRAVTANVETQVIFPDKEEREKIDYRSKLDLPGRVRIVIFPGYDACACCAPHVRRSGEIGLVKMLSVQKWKGGVRINILCGARAIAFMQMEHRAAQSTARYLSVGMEEMLEAVTRRQAAFDEVKGKLRETQEELLMEHARSCAFFSVTPSQYDGNEPDDEIFDGQPIILFEKPLDMNAVRSAITRVAEAGAFYCAVFLEKEPGSFYYCIGSKTQDMREIQKKLKEKLGARGGGKPEMVQGSLVGSDLEIVEALQ